MNNSIAVHSHTDLINIYNNECNNYSESVNNRQYNIDKRNSDNIFNIKHNSLGHNNSDNRYCICNNILLKLIIPVIILAVITLGSIMVKASETDTRPYLKKYYTSVEVTSDDTLWSLEADYNNGLEDRNTYINNIMPAYDNNLLHYPDYSRTYYITSHWICYCDVISYYRCIFR